MVEGDIQNLSAIDALQLMRSLPCYKIYLSPGRENCTAARHKAGVEPENVGRGTDTIAHESKRFATICQTCPVLLAGFVIAFAKPN